MNRLKQLFSSKEKDILNIYFTAGYPKLHDTPIIVQELDRNGVDLIEIGMPYSDPLADGPTIQASGTQALQNGMTLPLLFEQIEQIRKHTEIPLILMGYFNQMMQYGDIVFLEKCAQVGVDGLILPDMPLYVYKEQYQKHFERWNLGISFLITPQTNDERIRKIDRLSRGFIYMVSSAAITGATGAISETQLAYFKRIRNMQLQHPRLIGFGISDYDTFSTACRYAQGAIIGSAFIRAIAQEGPLPILVNDFISKIRGTIDIA